MTRSKLATTPALVLLGLIALTACLSPQEEAPTADTTTGAPVPQTGPKPPTLHLKKELPTVCSLLPPDELRNLLGFPAKRWKQGNLGTDNPLLASCAWRLDAPKPVILSLVVRSNPKPQRRADWSRKILQPLIADGRTDKKGTNYPYEAVPELGSQAAWSSADGQLRWSEGHRYLFTLHTQKANLLTQDQFLTLARSVRAKILK